MSVRSAAAGGNGLPGLIGAPGPFRPRTRLLQKH